MDPAGIFILEPTSGLHLEYLAEGAANIIYKPLNPPESPTTEADLRFIPDGSTPTPPPTDLQPLMIDPRLDGKLIRLRKDLSTVLPVRTSWDHFQNVVSPLFLDSQLVSQTLFKISPLVIKDLNVELRQMESHGQRPSKRNGNYLAEDESYGSLVSDMSSNESSVSLEFKPKWLVQSPSAPSESKRCRTCALQAMRLAARKDDHGAEDGRSGFCPLRLASSDRPQVVVAVDQILASPKLLAFRDERLKELIVDWILNASLLQRLKQLQVELDPVGTLEADLATQDILTAMTLRDCTLFLRVRACLFLICQGLGLTPVDADSAFWGK